MDVDTLNTLNELFAAVLSFAGFPQGDSHLVLIYLYYKALNKCWFEGWNQAELHTCQETNTEGDIQGDY